MPDARESGRMIPSAIYFMDLVSPGQVVIRPYTPADRAAVRKICCDTADCGEPVEHFFQDREVFADLVCRYYTDFEPEASWVAECDGQVAGYLNGCLDPRRFQRTMALRVLPGLLAKIFTRGLLTQTWARRFMALNLPLWLHRKPSAEIEIRRYPAHFHINLEPTFRAHHVGHALIDAFLPRLQLARIPGVHVSVREDNNRARKFFEHFGFNVFARVPFMRLPARPEEVLYSILYGKSL